MTYSDPQIPILRNEPARGMGITFQIFERSPCGNGYRVLLPNGGLFEIDDGDMTGRTVS